MNEINLVVVFFFSGSEKTRWTLDLKLRECFILNDMKLVELSLVRKVRKKWINLFIGCFDNKAKTIDLLNPTKCNLGLVQNKDGKRSSY